MERHAGFGAVASVTEDTINKVIATYFQAVQGLYFIPMPQSLREDGTTVNFAGILEMDPPTVELHANPADQVIANFTFRTTLRAAADGQPMQSWTLQFTTSGVTQLIPQIQNNQVVVGINAAQTTLNPLQVSGARLPRAILNALQSPQLAAILTAFIRALAPLIATPPLMSTQYSHTQKGEFKKSGFSEFDWFTVALKASRIVARPLEKALTVAVDFATFTQGDASQLVDLTSVRGLGTVYYRTIYPTTALGAQPILQRASEPSGTPIAMAFNLDVLRQIVDRQISPKIAGTPLTDKVVLNWISLDYRQFDKRLRGREDAFDLHFNFTFNPGITADGDAYFQPYLETWDGPTGFVQPDRWQIAVTQVDVDEPFWAELLLGTVEFLMRGYSIYGLILTTFNWKLQGVVDDWFNNVLSSFNDAAEGNIAAAAQAALHDATVELPRPWDVPLPGTAFPRWQGMLHYVAFSSEGLELGIKTWPDWEDIKDQPRAVITPTTWSAADRHPIPVSLKLRDDLARMAGSDLMLDWYVQRTDNGMVVTTLTGRYDAKPFNGPLLKHHTENLYLAPGFLIRCVATLTVGSQVGEIWRGEQVLTIDDILDRRHSFVTWGPHDVVFSAPDSTPANPHSWSHVRRSRIHRTAVAARCKMVKAKAIDELQPHPKRPSHKPKVPLVYHYDLPFAWEDLLSYRRKLCDYCFFGGPDKAAARPREDWYEPLPNIITTPGVFHHP
jgi:hypothetical protein